TRQRIQRGQDLRYDLHLTLEEAVFGTTKEISLTKHVTCTRCTGNGMEPGSQPTKCPRCEGSGEIRRVQQSIFGQFVNVTLCDRCNGKELPLKIPAGTQSGRIIRLRAEGVPYLREHGRGDLQVHVKVRIPTDLSDDQKKLFRQLSATFGNDTNAPTENKSFFDKVKDV